MDSADILYEVTDGIAVVTINRPHKKNAMGWGALAQFRDALRQAAADDDVLAVVITGAGGAFCAGTDLSELGETAADRRGGNRDADEWPWMVASCPKPVVAAIDGPAVGMGADIATQADLRIASTRARIAWNFVHRGLVPDTGAGSYLLPRQIGLSNALRLVLSGEFLEADEALRLGYVMEVVAPEELGRRAIDLARRISRGSPFAARRAKQLIYAGLGRDEAGHLAAHRTALQECFASADHKEGVASFIERREPRFTGR
ncbi:enoyl-CoA hydratase/isomerase family protein [Cumulibacter manganitolerans]|uniref:enoyl-CoA hydratase/isomerase family protein n=1 Tax=Cumulibacter manganitolerans TaxID=1884992 RepID=UPI001295A151|nr:enoyl-CoA hydratase-related protein [Cumulibacter manganitolerans]